MSLDNHPVKLIYLHGFNSSPDSHKARLLLSYMQQRSLQSFVEIPEIPPYPEQAFKMLRSVVESAQKQYEVALAGSSLGGFYATALAECYGLRAVLINPAVRPHLLLEKYLGDNTNYYTSAHWTLNTSHIQALRDLDVEPVSRPERYMLMLQMADETLDYRDAEQKYQGAQAYIESGGSHCFDNFKRYIPRMLKFSGFMDEELSTLL